MAETNNSALASSVAEHSASDVRPSTIPGFREVSALAAWAAARARALPNLRWRWWYALPYLALAAAALYAHTRLYGIFFIDDGLISLRYTDRLLHGQGLTWTDGERVEGYSNLLWVLLCAVPGLFVRTSLIAEARALGFLCMLAAYAALLTLATPRRLRDALAPLFAAWILAATDSLASWTTSGLELPLGVALLAWATVCTLRALDSQRQAYVLAAAACFGLLCWTRPDGPLWGCGAVLALGCGLPRRTRALCLAIAASVTLFLGSQLLFRRLYYQEWLPNTAYAKLVLNDEHLKQGLAQLVDSFVSLPALWLALCCGLLGGALDKSARLGAWLLAVLAALWVGYQARAGGDLFPAWRHWGYFACIAVVAWLHWLRQRPGAWTFAPAGAGLIALAAVSTHFDPMNYAATALWALDGRPIGRALQLAAGKERPLVAVDAAGTIPFFSKLPALDMLGLTDRYLAHHPPKNMGVAAQMGHELGDTDYFLRRAPDVFCFGAPPCRVGGVYPAQQRLFSRHEFLRDYQLVELQVTSRGITFKNALYVRKLGKLGLQRSASALEVPALLLGRDDHAFSEVDAKERLVARLEPGIEVSVPELELSPGTWRVQAHLTQGSGNVLVRGDSGELLTQGDAATAPQFTLRAPAIVTLGLRAGTTELAVTSLSISAVP